MFLQPKKHGHWLAIARSGNKQSHIAATMETKKQGTTVCASPGTSGSIRARPLCMEHGCLSTVRGIQRREGTPSNASYQAPQTTPQSPPDKAQCTCCGDHFCGGTSRFNGCEAPQSPSVAMPLLELAVHCIPQLRSVSTLLKPSHKGTSHGLTRQVNMGLWSAAPI